MLSTTLTSLIEKELAWREKELALAKGDVLHAISNRAKFPHAYRAFIVITYCHYEGFCKRVIAQAVDDICKSSIERYRWKPLILERIFSKSARKLVDNCSNTELVIMLSAKCHLDNLNPLAPESFLATSNLDYKTLVKLLETAGINDSPYSQYRLELSRLVYLRHDCAHGEILSFDASQSYKDLADVAFALQSTAVSVMHQLAVDLIDGFQAHHFYS